MNTTCQTVDSSKQSGNQANNELTSQSGRLHARPRQIGKRDSLFRQMLDESWQHQWEQPDSQAPLLDQIS